MSTFLHLTISRLTIVAAAISALSFGCGGGSSGGSSGSSGSAGSGGSGGAGGDACDAYVTSPSQSTVTVRLANNTAVDLYVGATMPPGCGSPDPFSIAGPNGEALAWHQGDCGFTCEQMIAGSCACTDNCPVPRTILLKPGGTYDISWGGTIFSAVQMPASCYSTGCGPASSCYLEQAPPQGTLTFRASAWTAVGMCMMMPCTCAPDENGSCAFDSFEAAVSGTEHKAQADVSMIGKVVEVAFN